MAQAGACTLQRCQGGPCWGRRWERGSQTTSLRRTWAACSRTHLWAAQPLAPQGLLLPGARDPTCPFPLLPCTHPERRFPRAAPQRTRRRFVWCTPCQRCSQAPSTSGAAGPAGGRASVSHRGGWRGGRPSPRQWGSGPRPQAGFVATPTGCLLEWLLQLPCSPTPRCLSPPSRLLPGCCAGSLQASLPRTCSGGLAQPPGPSTAPPHSSPHLFSTQEA